MESLGARPVWSMSGGEKLSTLDHVHADIARLETYRLQLIAGLDEDGHAQDVGARDTVQLVEFRYRLNHSQALRDVRVARALKKYPAVSAALPTVQPADPAQPTGPTGPVQPADSAGPAAGSERPAPVVRLRPAQAEAIVSALEKVPSTVPAEDIEVAERELVRLARHLCPADLRTAAQTARDILDTDGPEPEEHKASARESLTLTAADRGVKFRGYLANENAELLRTLIHAGARPHKTPDGHPDPRPREKRQADALTTALTIAATATDTGHPHRATRPTTTTDTAPATNTRAPADASTADASNAASPPDLLGRRRRHQDLQSGALVPTPAHRPARRSLDHHHHQRQSPRGPPHLGQPTKPHRPSKLHGATKPHGPAANPVRHRGQHRECLRE